MNECHIAAKLTALRTVRNLTQDEVGAALGVSGKTISKWETGTTSPDLNMLISLSEFYKVSTDTLLGLKDTTSSTQQLIFDEFNGLTRQESALKIFEIITAIFPASYDAAMYDDADADLNAIPPISDRFNRYQIEVPELFSFAVASDAVNVAVFQLRNKSNFAWLNDEEKQSKIVKFLHFIGDAEVLKICAFTHTTTCSTSFTVDYIVKNTGVSHERTAEILDMFCDFGICRKNTAHLGSGDIVVYESFGDGLLLAILSLVYERLWGKRSYAYNYSSGCKMIIGGDA